MNPYLSDQHLALKARVREFAQEAIVPVARELDERSEFPWENVKAMGEMGLLGVPVPRELGGMGLDYLSYILVVEDTNTSPPRVVGTGAVMVERKL